MNLNLYPITFAALSPLSEPITIIRRQQAVGANGRVEVFTTTIPNVRAYVLASSPSDLERNPDYSLMRDTITADVKYPLQGPMSNPPDGYQPDHVIWHGNEYVVTKVNDFSKQGRGFVSVILQTVNSVDGPTMSS